MINKTDSKSYAFISNSDRAVAAGSYLTFSIKVKVTGTAKAIVRLIDSETDAPITHVFEDKTNDFSVTITDTQGQWKTVRFYIENGASILNYRLELWNGTGAEDDTTTGYVFFDDVKFDTFFANIIEDAERSGVLDVDSQIFHARVLTDEEIKFNETAADEDKIDNSEKVIWANSTDGTFKYAIYSTIDPIHENLEDDGDDDTETPDEPTEETERDPGMFWLQFSSILLAVCIIAAIIALLVKKNRKGKKGKKAVQSHYKVSSRNNIKKVNKPEPKKEEVKAEPVEEPADEVAEEPIVEEEAYEYGEVVEDFSEDTTEPTDEVVEAESTENNDQE